MVEVKPSTRQTPYIRFETDEKAKLHRQAVEVEGLSKRFENQLFKNLSFILEAGERLAIIGPNGAGKSTLLKLLAGAFNPEYSEGVQPDTGTIKWAEKANVGYYPQDHENDFDVDMNLTEWMRQWVRKATTNRLSAAHSAVCCSAATTWLNKCRYFPAERKAACFTAS
ncbi:putative ABC-transporter, ATP-binding protein [Neisseria zoodegmatis]|uniref:Putative ABC-transporter, ATP-binding protein n=1 Tax=Neisseria zoodegmatis TaxID=326523 RepID=A0A378WTV7_9NEIS|nr:putative ABC-transporter, ATP-binding protein [Neisseria zoodegmatis]